MTPGVRWYLRALKSYALYSNSLSNTMLRMITDFFHTNVGGRDHIHMLSANLMECGQLFI